ncbi:MAG: DUF2924 domain-containing protein [Candidatus Afipia apatlaquensis]|uniref:DUF2924 domain-containing protein n=1 Tax=Candidatus Afipia apatlaquensis TaxID=2712852 RepID=A0A7C9VP35_9BRAD|nr:DUF2924 domain-containing protein [Candidatus Afipia apatlaquensis]
MDRPTARPRNAKLERQLKEVARSFKSSLIDRYRQLFGRDPPKAFGPDLLRRSVAHRLQENAYGGLSKPAQRELNRLVRLMIARPDARLRIPRQVKTGTELVRDFRGKSHRVQIMQDGFLYDGKVYASLSEIARLITGTRWNGPRFFGLRRNAAEKVAETPVQPARAIITKRARTPYGL